jgi:hypothetical protein
MVNEVKYENFPLRIVIISNLVSILIYTSGLVITLSLSWIAAILYVSYIMILEYRLLSKHCINCYYWGKTCGFGKGRVSSLICRKGDSSGFSAKTFNWVDMIPDLLVTLIPLMIALFLMIVNFRIILLIATLLIIFLATKGNGYVRGKLTCRHCKQGESGCPALQLFSKNK